MVKSRPVTWDGKRSWVEYPGFVRWKGRRYKDARWFIRTFGYIKFYDMEFIWIPDDEEQPKEK